MARIFISYRRDDSSGYAGRLYDRLAEMFGRQEMFMDVDDIQPGLDFVEVIREAVWSCDVFIVLIGKRWRPQRLRDPKDPVRIEIMTAFEKGIHVIPVLIDGAKMPPGEALPQPLEKLSRLNALGLVHARFDATYEKLLRTLQTVLAKPYAMSQPKSEEEEYVSLDKRTYARKKKKRARSEGAVVDEEKCTGCEVCVAECPSEAITMVGDKAYVDEEECINCGVCVDACPEEAITME
ncbi:MAG: 4Fe-4S binding protein [Planctomycetota bacterium]|jgi:NAD-dependent dihydropyrimidine dehydrogenase PreA subunit